MYVYLRIEHSIDAQMVRMYRPDLNRHKDKENESECIIKRRTHVHVREVHSEHTHAHEYTSVHKMQYVNTMK